MGVKLTESKKRLVIVLGTIIGLLALFLFIVFVPIDNDNPVQDIMSDEVVENELADQQTNISQIGDDDADIKALDGTTHIVNNSDKETEDSDEDVDSDEIEIPVPDDDVDYVDGSEFVDSEYTNYTDDVPADGGLGTENSGNGSDYAENNSTQNSDLSDNGL